MSGKLGNYEPPVVKQYGPGKPGQETRCLGLPVVTVYLPVDR